jgi:acyl-CoA-binding protein
MFFRVESSPILQTICHRKIVSDGTPKLSPPADVDALARDGITPPCDCVKLKSPVGETGESSPASCCAIQAMSRSFRLPQLPWWQWALVAGGGLALAKIGYDALQQRRRRQTAHVKAGPPTEAPKRLGSSDPFEAAVEHSKSVNMGRFTIPDKLELYAYYKQATVGPCTIERPSAADFAGRAKWDAWNACGSMPVDEAKQRYIDCWDKHMPGWRALMSPAEGAAKPSSAGPAGGAGDDSAGAFSHTSKHTGTLLQDDAAAQDEDEDEAEVAAAAKAAKAAAASSGAGSGSATATAAAPRPPAGLPRSAYNRFLDLLASGSVAEIRTYIDDQCRSDAAAGPLLVNGPLNAAGERSLHIAADAGRVDVTAALLAAGADPRLTEKEGGATPLHYAIMMEQAEVAEALLAADATLLTAPADADGKTCADLAAARGVPSEIKQLAERFRRAASS